jgi:hypothetical protein
MPSARSTSYGLEGQVGAVQESDQRACPPGVIRGAARFRVGIPERRSRCRGVYVPCHFAHPRVEGAWQSQYGMERVMMKWIKRFAIFKGIMRLIRNNRR